MGVKTLVFPLVLLNLACFLVLVSSDPQICMNSACHPREPSIRFPFRLQDNQHKQCGYPGFDLACDGSSLTILRLQNSSFTIQAIDYASQEIWLNDPDHCLPRLLLNLKLSGTPFRGVYYQDFTLFNCSSDDYNHRNYNFNPIACLGDSNYNVIATSSRRGARLLAASSCTPITTIPVPVQWPFYEQVWSSDLSEDIRLTWDSPQCGKCESKGGRCGLKANSTDEIECSDQRGLPRGARYAISVGAGVPAVLFIIGFVCFVVSRLKACGRRRNQGVEFTFVVAPQPTSVSGLDEAVIESFPKTVLGQSRRGLSSPDDSVCPICLGEYKLGDTLRSIPACKHCFHSSCIDEWLRLNATCPVCRKNQKQSPAAVAPQSAPAADDNV